MMGQLRCFGEEFTTRWKMISLGMIDRTPGSGRLVIWVEGSFAIPGKGISEMWVYITKKSGVQTGGGHCYDIQHLFNELFSHTKPSFMLNLEYRCGNVVSSLSSNGVSGPIIAERHGSRDKNIRRHLKR